MTCSTHTFVEKNRLSPFFLDETGQYYIDLTDIPNWYIQWKQGMIESIPLRYCPECGEKFKCGLCLGEKVVVRDFYDPRDNHGHRQSEEPCVCVRS